MNSTPLPLHPFTGLRALAVLSSGRPVWPVMGGSDDPPAPEGSGPGGDGGTAPAVSFTQADVDRIVGERLARERQKVADYDDLKAKAARLDELEEATKSDQQKLIERAEAAERRANEAEQRATASEVQTLRTKVAVAKGLPPALAARLTGTTEEEIAADADDLLAAVAPATPAAQPAPSFDHGARSATPPAATVASGADLYAQRHKKT